MKLTESGVMPKPSTNRKLKFFVYVMGMPRFKTNLSDGPFVKFEDALVMSKTTY